MIISLIFSLYAWYTLNCVHNLFHIFEANPRHSTTSTTPTFFVNLWIIYLSIQPRYFRQMICPISYIFICPYYFCQSLSVKETIHINSFQNILKFLTFCYVKILFFSRLLIINLFCSSLLYSSLTLSALFIVLFHTLQKFLFLHIYWNFLGFKTYLSIHKNLKSFPEILFQIEKVLLLKIKTYSCASVHLALGWKGLGRTMPNGKSPPSLR